MDFIKCLFTLSLPFYLSGIGQTQSNHSKADSLSYVRTSTMRLIGKVTDDKGHTLTGARMFLVEIPNATSYIGGHPPTSQLEKMGAEIIITKDDFTVNIDATIPHAIYFTAPGKKTIDTYLPSGLTGTVNFKVSLFDESNIRDERIPSISTDNITINLFIKAHALSNLSTNTDVKAQMDSSINYSIRQGTKDGFTFDLRPYYESMLSIYRATANRELKNYVLLNLSFLSVGDKFPVEEKYIKEAIHETPPSDVVWLAESGKFVRGCYLGLGGFEKNKDLLLPFMEQLVDQCPVDSIKPLQLYSLLYYADRAELPQASIYYAKLITDYPDSKQTQNAVKRFNKNLKIDAGKGLPLFSIADIDKKGVMINGETASGKVRLIDFWATWCGPCVGQLGRLDSLYKIYHNKGLEIISISFDQNPETVVKFRAKKWKMPWINGFCGYRNTDIMDKFEIFGIPKLVLVDGDGKIISANQKELEGEGLELLLKKYLLKH